MAVLHLPKIGRYIANYSSVQTVLLLVLHVGNISALVEQVSMSFQVQLNEMLMVLRNNLHAL